MVEVPPRGGGGVAPYKGCIRYEVKWYIVVRSQSSFALLYNATPPSSKAQNWYKIPGTIHEVIR